MGHIADGRLRRMHDEPMAVPERARMHYSSCRRCQERFQGIAADARQAAGVLALPLAALDSRSALERVRRQTAARPPSSQTAFPAARAALQINTRRFARPAAVGLVAAILAGVLMASGMAQSFLTIFEPRQFVAVPVSRSDYLSAMAELSDYGSFKWSAAPNTHEVADPGAAAAESGFRVLTPSALPSGVPSAVRYLVVPYTTGTFTFSAERTRAAAARVGKPLPLMPASIDGSSLYVSAGPVLLQIYGISSDGKSGSTEAGGILENIPALVIAQEKAPTVASSGVSLRQLEDYLLAQPGISPQLKAQLRAINDPATTLPIPIPADQASSHPVQVQGVRGLFVGDSTGLGSGAIWQKDGVVYGVAGMLTESQVLAIADSLH